MIRYDLRCDNDHRFDGWFASAEAFDTSKTAGMISCTVCGSVHVEKMLMAPALRAERPLAPTPREEALAALRRAVEENSDYVGMNFAAEARAIHDGDAPERAIWGEARPEEARALIDDGIPVAPLPFTGPRKVN